MKLKKAAAVIMSVAMIGGAGVCNGFSDIMSYESVSAIGLVPYSLKASLGSNVFVVNEGENIDNDDLIGHDLVIDELVGYAHDMPQDELYGQITPSDTYNRHSVDECTVTYPEKLVNGTNTLTITYVPHNAPSYAVSTDLRIFVKFSEDLSLPGDILPDFINASEDAVTKYKRSGKNESYCVVEKDSARVYNTNQYNNVKTLVYQGDDIEKLRADFPDIDITAIYNDIKFNCGSLSNNCCCVNKADDLSYYNLNTDEMTQEEYSDLYADLLVSDYAENIYVAQFVSQRDIEIMDISFMLESDTEPVKEEFSGLESFTYEDNGDGTYKVEASIGLDTNIYQALRSIDLNSDVSDVQYNYIWDMEYIMPEWCYLVPAVMYEINVPGVNKAALVYGDTDLNGVADMSDLTLLSQYLLGDKKLDEKGMLCADVTGDNDVSLADLSHFKQYIGKENVKLGPQ
ncbi:MAG: dockerin type I repeat-containing protein [Oscillospiraceae bacterium]|nr:dockerin type I repeat-containing protein [Oscillospiraceae bacterium]